MIKSILKGFLGTMMFTCFWLIVLIYRDTIRNLNDIGFKIVLVLMLGSSMIFLVLSTFGDDNNDR
jgi:hypothetical protein